MELNQGLLGHWPFRQDLEDHSPSGLCVRNANVKIGDAGPDGPHSTAALYNGLDAHLLVSDHPALHLGTGDFTVCAWIRVARNRGDGSFDVLSKFDAKRCRGLTLYVTGSAPGYNSVSDVRNLHFGIDNGVLEPWIDHGKPWASNTLISTLTAYQGQLYTGIADAARTEDAPSVFRFRGGTDWEWCGRLAVDPRTRSVQSMIVHDGHLYAGTGNWDWTKANARDCGPTHVFRYDDGQRWHDCGQFGEGFRVLSLASYHGDLYAGDDTGKVYRFDGDHKWAFCGQLGTHNRVNAMMLFRDRLYGAPHGAIFRYKGGTAWARVGGGEVPGTDLLFGENQTHTLQVYGKHLWAGMWPHGKALRYEEDDEHGRWSDRGQLGISTERFKINEINDLKVYNGKLYAGVIPQGKVYRYQDGRTWQLIKRLVDNERMDPEDVYSWNRVPCLTVFQGRLFAGTATCHGIASDHPHPQVGRVYSMEAGRNVSFDQDLGAGWRHIGIVRKGGLLSLYINGGHVADSDPFGCDRFDLTNEEPLQIGVGEQNYFCGAMSDLRLYGRALAHSQIRELASYTDTPSS